MGFAAGLYEDAIEIVSNLPDVRRQDIAGMTVFTTQSITREMLAIRADLARRPPPQLDMSDPAIARVYEGDMERQIDAMWAYFGLGEFLPLPDEVRPDAELALGVGERPLVHRAFLESAGSRGIAVGMPVGVHYAIDARNGNLREVWQGAFLDASGSWAGRGGTILGGQGRALWRASEDLDVARGTLELVPPRGEPGTRFKGYRLDESGAPTFLLDVDGFDVTLRFEVQGAPEPRVKRIYRIENYERLVGVVLTVEEGVDVKASFAGSPPRGMPAIHEKHGKRYAYEVPASAEWVEASAEVKQ